MVSKASVMMLRLWKTKILAFLNPLIKHDLSDFVVSEGVKEKKDQTLLKRRSK